MGGKGSGRTKIPDDEYRVQMWFRMERKFCRMLLEAAKKDGLSLTNYMRNLVISNLVERKIIKES